MDKKTLDARLREILAGVGLIARAPGAGAVDALHETAAALADLLAPALCREEAPRFIVAVGKGPRTCHDCEHFHRSHAAECATCAPAPAPPALPESVREVCAEALDGYAPGLAFMPTAKLYCALSALRADPVALALVRGAAPDPGARERVRAVCETGQAWDEARFPSRGTSYAAEDAIKAHVEAIRALRPGDLAAVCGEGKP